MATRYSPKIVTDGLIFAVDPLASKNSTGSDGANGMVDLVGGHQLDRSGSPVVTKLGPAGGDCWHFSAQTQYYENATSIPNGPGKNATIEAWIYPQAELGGTSGKGTIVRTVGGSYLYLSWSKSTAKISTYWYNHDDSGSAGYHDTGAAMTRNAWHHVCTVHNYNDALVYQYTDLVKTSAATKGTAVTSGGVEIGAETADRQFSGGIALVRIYNIALTDAQVLQNYNASKGRFGL